MAPHPGQRSGGEPARPGRRSRSRRWGQWALVGLGLAALAGWWLHAGAPAVDWARLLKPLGRTLIYLAAGLLLGQLLEGLGLARAIGRKVTPFLGAAHLPPEAGTAFAAAFASGITANTLLYTSWQEGRLKPRELVLANLLNASLPAYFLHLPTTFFVVYALLGDAALVYFGLTLLAACLRFAGVLLIGRCWLPACPDCELGAPPARPTWREVARDTWSKFRRRFQRLLVIILPVYLVIYLLSQSGAFARLGESLAGWVTWAWLPVEAMSVIVFSLMAEFTSGFAAAAALMQAGDLDLRQVVTALLIGNLLATPLRVLRHQLPHYLAIYSPRLGSGLLALGQTVRVVSVLIVTIAFNLAWDLLAWN